ncbi:DUF192 domain-containing protein [Allofranklinella schreckenbergeri]|uniref:DUF192 domain-containing protein n=2 Tax=Allofranklinella schreckenbergeri TaxID=1076744 RepID=A0A3M6R850_9BURK|nr:DUF192 domain-containing protein [Allofranklinella schreckenbergeri]
MLGATALAQTPQTPPPQTPPPQSAPAAPAPASNTAQSTAPSAAPNTAPNSNLAQLDLPRATLSILMHRIDAQIASTPAQRQVGLMFRASMPAQEGMLFVFERPAVQCFWMKNTWLPLTAAFIDEQGVIVNLADMQPMTTDSHCSEKPVRYVLEMNQGWFAQRNLGPGSKLTGGPFKR